MCMQGWRSLVFDKSRLKAPSPYALLSEDMQHIYYHYGIAPTPISELLYEDFFFIHMKHLCFKFGRQNPRLYM